MIDERITNWIAGGAALNFVWLPSFGALQYLLAVLGIVWLGIQIYYRLKKGE